MNREIREEIGGRGEMIKERVEEVERDYGRKVGDDIWKKRGIRENKSGGLLKRKNKYT